MKTTLTVEQSATLIARGISAERASAVDDIRAVIDGVPTFSPGTKPIFTLADLLSLLPKHISLANADWCLNIQWNISWGKWCVRYLDFIHGDEVVKKEEAPELIDALYQLTLAVINHVKLD